MFRSMRKPGRDSQARWLGIGEPGSRLAAPGRRRPTTRARRRNQRLNCEALEGRQMLSGFYIVNMESGLALDDTNSSTSNGNLIQQWQPTGGLDQQWNLVSLPDGNDEIVNASSGKVLDDTNWSTSNGTPIQQWQATRRAQPAMEDRLAGRRQRQEIVNAYSGKALDDTGFSTSNGTMIQQWQPTGGVNQQWALLAAGNAPTVTNYVVDASSGKVLDDTNCSTSNGNLMQQWQPTGGSNQQWTFISLADGNDLIVNVDSGKVLDDTGWSTSDGTKIQQWQATGGLNQEWEIVALADGYDEIVNAYSGKVLDDTNASPSNGNPIQQWQDNGGVSEHWKLLAAGNAPAVTDYVVNASSGKALDDPNFSTSNGTTIEQYQLDWREQPAVDVHLAGRRQRPDRQRVQRQGARRPELLDQQRHPGPAVPAQRRHQPAMVDLTLANGNDEILNAASHEVLDDPGFSAGPGTVIEQYPLNDGTNQQWTLFVPNANPDTDSNWSGYVAQTSLTSPQQDSVTFVTGTWVVPTMTVPSAFNSGFRHLQLIRLGGHRRQRHRHRGAGRHGAEGGQRRHLLLCVVGDVVFGGPAAGADHHQHERRAGRFDHGLGPVFSSGTHAGQFELTITDNSRSNDSFTTYQTSSATQNPLATRSTAEWIVESPTHQPASRTLPDFGEVTFTDATR